MAYRCVCRCAVGSQWRLDIHSDLGWDMVSPREALCSQACMHMHQPSKQLRRAISHLCHVHALLPHRCQQP